MMFHHPLSYPNQTRANKYISLPHVLVRDESVEEDASKSKKKIIKKSQKINYDEHFCPIF